MYVTESKIYEGVGGCGMAGGGYWDNKVMGESEATCNLVQK